MSDENDDVTAAARTLGRKGGKRTSALHGPDFYREVGRRGGALVAAKMRAKDPDFYRKIGKLGGAKIAAKVKALDPDHFAKIGKKGGDAASAKLGPNHYRTIGKRGGHRVHVLIAAGRAALKAQDEAEGRAADAPAAALVASGDKQP